jgi:Na+/proline symporter
MKLSVVDWVVIAVYVLFALGVGIAFARRASKNLNEFFLSGRRLPWWMAGTSMVATTFAADTPLVITGWVRDHGIWKNWLWWGFALSTMLSVFLFARLWRRGGVMTKAEMAELRYGERDGSLLRGALGVLHAGFTNTITLCWVLLASAKIVDVLFDIDKGVALVAACAIALTYALLAGFWGVVLTDLVQFVIATIGAVALAWVAWEAVGGLTDASTIASLPSGTLDFVPSPGEGGLSGTWSTAFAIVVVNLGIGWWASESVDGNGLAVQRISASRDERHGSLSVLWYAVANYALRPWPWIVVAVASLLVLPDLEIVSPISGTVERLDEGAVWLTTDSGAQSVSLEHLDAAADWRPSPETVGVAVGDHVVVGDVVARTDPERAYVTMLGRYLPPGLLGLVVASLIAAFMSTIDTHVNLAASFFTSDLYRRFVARKRSAKHYVMVARLASVFVMVVAAAFAYLADSISNLFTFMLAFLGGVGPVCLMRWFWWRVRASTEMTAMVASALATILFTFIPIPWPDTSLSPGGELVHEGRLILVVVSSMVAAGLSLWLGSPPKPRELVAFYDRVRPPGLWAPVRRLWILDQGDETTIAAADRGDGRRRIGIALIGSLAGVAMIYGAMFAIGHLLFARGALAALSSIIAIAGAAGVVWAIRRQGWEPPRDQDAAADADAEGEARVDNGAALE